MAKRTKSADITNTHTQHNTTQHKNELFLFFSILATSPASTTGNP